MKIPASNYGAPVEVLREKLKDKPIWFSPDLMSRDWEKNVLEYCSRAPRAKMVRKELHKMAESATQGGMWKHLDFDLPTGTGSIEVAIVSRPSFLSLLSHDEST